MLCESGFAVERNFEENLGSVRAGEPAHFGSREYADGQFNALTRVEP